MTVTHGTTRFVILTKRYAIKLPYISFKKYGFTNFLCGLLANINESQYTEIYENEYGVKHLPIIFHIGFGIMNVMRRIEPIKKEDFIKINNSFKQKYGEMATMSNDTSYKNFGWYKGEIYCFDYV